GGPVRSLEDKAGEEGPDLGDGRDKGDEQCQAAIGVLGLVSFRLLHAARRRSVASSASVYQTLRTSRSCRNPKVSKGL
ncbi:MAG: hypothetical protein OXF26_09465, partial [Alphaproteobacteria bacterium]|nr:hypothetical protein [Alphaproteobacteria bacterium]